MPCLFGCFALVAPRFVILVLVIFSDYIGRSFDAMIWPVLGFFFLPTTTLAYAFAINQAGGLEGVYLILCVVAILVDFGLLGGGGHSTYYYHRSRIE